MKKIVGYFSEKPTWRVTSVKEYKKKFNHDLAISYLKNEIFESVDREINHILSGNSVGFYAGLRFLFAELTYLSRLYWGNDSEKTESAHVVRFMRKFNILSPEYGVHYEVFRHGLMHTHHPKWIKKRTRVINWYISNKEKLTSFGVCIPEFSDQIKRAIRNFGEELKVEKILNKNTRLNKFLETIISAGEILTRKDLKKYAKTDFPKVNG